MSTAPDAPTATQNPRPTPRPRGNPGLERLLTITELSEYLGIPVATIYDWRVDGKGPRGLRVGRHLRFAVDDVQTWLATLRENESGRDGTSAPPCR